MNPAPLSARQNAAIDTLVRAGKLRRVAVDLPKAERFLEQAREGVTEAQTIKLSKIMHGVAYDAAHDCGEAVLAAYGITTTNGPGQHVAVGDALKVIYDTPPESIAANHYDQMRVARNSSRYIATAVGAAQATAALNTAQTLLKATTTRLN